jgi:lipopolysaccharide cholinephosphotransferase
MDRKYTPEELTRLHDVLYEILAEIDRICMKYDIKYFVTGGTAIGVYFWQSIIPWDDDVDVGMTRYNYIRFIEVAQAELGDKYFLQTPQTDKHSLFFFAKVRKNGTIFSESQFQHVNMHQGIYVDIFPFDDIPENESKQKRQHNIVFFLNGLFIATEVWQYKHFGKCHVPHPRKKSLPTCLMFRLLITLIPKSTIGWMLHKAQTWYNGNTYTECKNIITHSEHLPKKNATDTQRMPLGPLMVQAPKDILQYLNNHYGSVRKDYPIELQTNHCPAVLYFGEESNNNDNK